LPVLRPGLILQDGEQLLRKGVAGLRQECAESLLAPFDLGQGGIEQTVAQAVQTGC
jgi:hypothetical protein